MASLTAVYRFVEAAGDNYSLETRLSRWLLQLPKKAIFKASRRTLASTSGTLPSLFGWWLQYFWGITLMLIAMLAWDWFKHKRVMRPVVWGAALLWSGEAVVTILNFSPVWKAAMVALVKVWGYAG